jgi:hypothetical protein
MLNTTLRWRNARAHGERQDETLLEVELPYIC